MGFGLANEFIEDFIFTITRGWHNRPGMAAVPIVSQTNLKKKKLPLLSFTFLSSPKFHQ
jgi:hypothetical protein